MNTVKVRRYDIDWLRVILFGLLIPFHVAIGVYWSTYGAEINPSMETCSIIHDIWYGNCICIQKSNLEIIS